MNAPLASHRALLSLALLALPLAAGCSRPPAPVAEAAADATYTVRAQVARLPAVPGGELYLRHETIPEFKNSQGDTVGMFSMTMPFGAPAELDLTGIAEGDRVEVTFEVRWSAASKPLRVTRLVRLPPGTRLEFDEPDAAPAQPAGETPR